MKCERERMGMPISVLIAGEASQEPFNAVFDYFAYVDATFSTYKRDSEMMRINRGEIMPEAYSADMKEILRLAEETKRLTGGYFDITTPDGSIDPSGIVKGWAIRAAARILEERGYDNFCINAGGDIAARGLNEAGEEWRFGIRSPFSREGIVKVVYPRGRGVATSGAYIRGNHIYDPHTKRPAISELASITVIGPDIFEADRFATAAYAMGEDGAAFIEGLDGFEAYAIRKDGVAVMTSGFKAYV